MTHTQDAPRLYELRQRAWPVGAGSKQRRVPSTLVSRKAIIDIARASRSSGLPQDGVRAQPLLFFGRQRVDEVRLRCNSTGTHQLSQAGFRNADRDGAVGGQAEPPRYDDSLIASRGSGPRAASGRREHPTSARRGSGQSKASLGSADLDPEVPPFVAREQAAQLVPSDLEVVDENHRLAVVADRVDLPSERAGEQLEAARAWMSRHVAARQPGTDALAHLAPGRLPGRDGEDEAQPGPGAVATLDGLEELPVPIHRESERPNGSGGIQILVDHRPVIVHGSAPLSCPRGRVSAQGDWPGKFAR